MTLVELLVVITIISILLGAAIPVLAPADDSRRLREAARAVNTFIAGAKTRAKETGRPFGVAFKKLSQDTTRPEDNGACLELYYVEELPPYAGFDSGARVMFGTDAVAGGAMNPDQVLVRFVSVSVGQTRAPNAPYGVSVDPIPTGVIRPGDVIQIGDKRFRFIDEGAGPGDIEDGFYTTDVGTPDNSLFVEPLNSSVAGLTFIYDNDGQRLADTPESEWNQRYWTEPLRYKILRQPTKASGEPLQLNEKTAIDLEASGFGAGVRLHDPYWEHNDENSPPPVVNSNRDDVIVMFSPEGAMREAYLNTGANTSGSARTLVSSNLFLLVGLRENIPAPETDFYNFSGTDRDKQDAKEAINWLNGDARWVVVGAQTGAVASVENAFVEPQTYATSVLDTSDLQQVKARRDAEIIAAREYARQAVSQGGK